MWVGLKVMREVVHEVLVLNTTQGTGVEGIIFLILEGPGFKAVGKPWIKGRSRTRVFELQGVQVTGATRF